MWGSNPRSPRYKHGALTNWAKGAVVTSAGFEPAHPKIIELKSIALDHSAMMSILDSILMSGPTTKPRAGLEPATLRLKV